MDRNIALEHHGILYLLSTTLLLVSNYLMTEETLYLFLATMCADSKGAENGEDGHQPVHQEDKGRVIYKEVDEQNCEGRYIVFHGKDCHISQEKSVCHSCKPLRSSCDCRACRHNMRMCRSDRRKPRKAEG